MWSATVSRKSRSWLMIDDGVRIAGQVVVEPQRAFEVEIVGRLVEEEQVGLRRTARPRAPRACASRRKTRSTDRACAAASKPSPCRMAAARAGAEWAPMSTRRVSISARRMASAVVSASAISALRSVSAASTTSISGSGPPGASWATAADAAGAAARDTVPPSGPTSPWMSRNRVVLPAPLRPTSPTRAPSGMAAVAPIENHSPANAIGEVVDMQHEALLALGRADTRTLRGWSLEPCEA